MKRCSTFAGREDVRCKSTVWCVLTVRMGSMVQSVSSPFSELDRVGSGVVETGAMSMAKRV